MSKSQKITLIFTFLGLWFLDCLSKIWATGLGNGALEMGPIGFSLYQNNGMILSSFTELPAVLRIVTLTTTGTIIILVFLAIQYLLQNRLTFFRSGLTILLAGILGNITDRISNKFVTDFIYVKLGSWISPIFNLADIIQWSGYLIILYSLFIRKEKIWHDNEKRNQLWVLPEFQKKFLLVILTAGLSFSIVSGVFSYTFLKITIEEIAPFRAELFEQKFLLPFLGTYIPITFTFLMILALLGRVLSHRAAGPIYAFETYLNDLLKGNDRSFKLRSGDDFKHLENVGERIREKLNSRQK